MNRRHFIKAIALFATIPLLPPGKEWVEETGWINLSASVESNAPYIIIWSDGPPETWIPRKDGRYDVYVMRQLPENEFHHAVPPGAKPVRIERHYSQFFTDIPMAPPWKE